MFSYLRTLPPADRAKEIAQIEAMLQEDPTALVPLYREAALQNTSREASSQMVMSITGVTVGAIFCGAFIGFPLALTAGTLFLAQQFWNSQKQKREARWAIEDGEDFTRFLDKEAQREYKHFAAAVKETSGHVLPHSEPAIDVPAIESELATEEAKPDTKKLTVAALQKRLAAECPDLLLLVKAPPIRLVGLQRTGKSTFARKLALLRAILLPGHCVAWSTPHREADNLVPEALHPFGTTADGAKDFRAIEAVWLATQGAIDKGQQLNTTVVWDEFGSYDAFKNPEALGVSLRSQLREATKHGYFPILVAHGDQANFYPGVTGILGTLRESTIKVETMGQQVDAYGTMAPTGRVMVTWLDGRMTEIQTPEWLTVELLLNLQPKQTKPALLDAIVASTLPLPTLPTDTHQTQPDDSFVGQSDADSKALEDKQRVQKKLIEKLKTSGSDWVNVRDLLKTALGSADDRKLGQMLLTAAIKKGILQHEERENPNKTKSYFVRVTPKA